MVYRDISSSESIQYNRPNEYRFKASLMDRFFSFVIDYLVFSPFVSFALFLLFHDSLIYWKTTPAAAETAALTVILAISYVFLFSLLQAFFIYRWQATPGQYFLKIQIQFENGRSFIFWRAFIRQFGFWCSFLFFGLPWLALLSHNQQKAFYDRIADFQVCSKKQTSAFFSFENENRYWQSLMATLMLFVGFIAISIFWMHYEEVMQRTASFRKLDKANHFCASLKNVSDATRLEYALAMNLVGQVSDKCLDREADFVLWSQKTDEVELAYYAKSITEADSEIEKKYLQKACLKNQESMGCLLATSFQTADFENLYQKMKSSRTVLARTLTYEFGLILNKADEQLENFSNLSEFDTNKAMKKYLISEIMTQPKNESARSPASDEATLIDGSDQVDKALHLLEDL
jgi:uncharacterized RDD family membrane protein YckC